MPKVTVIVPFYNVEKYIKKCIESLINQTLEDIEIIVVNDGSTDDSKKIIEEYVEKYPQKMVYLEKENGGLSDARNFAIPYAKGEYIAFLDSDDYVDVTMYKEMYDLAKKEDSDMVDCNFYWEYPNKVIEDIGSDYNGKHEMLEKARVMAWNKLIKRRILDNPELRFPVGYRYEDVEFTFKLIQYIDKVSFLRKPVVHYVQRGGSISNTQNERTKDIFNIFERVFEFYKEKGIFEEYYKELEYVYSRVLLCSSLKRLCGISDKSLRKKLIKYNWEILNKNFPNWKKNEILKKNRSGKAKYMKSVNKITYKFYALIFANCRKK